MTITDILVIVLVVFILLLVIFFAVLTWAADMDRTLQDKEWEHYGDFETNGWDSTDDAEQLAYIRKYNAKREAKRKKGIKSENIELMRNKGGYTNG